MLLGHEVSVSWKRKGWKILELCIGFVSIHSAPLQNVVAGMKKMVTDQVRQLLRVRIAVELYRQNDELSYHMSLGVVMYSKMYVVHANDTGDTASKIP